MDVTETEIGRDSSGDSAPTIAGVWQRGFAFVIDAIILGIPGYLLGFAFADTLVSLGGWGRLIGFGAGVFYFGWFDSVPGQSPGKRLLKIKVVTSRGTFLSAPMAALRYTVLALPYFLNGAPLNLDAEPAYSPLVAAGLSLAVVGLGLAMIYLILFNRRTRQSLHDLAVGAYVVKQTSAGVNALPVWKGHYVVVGLLLCAAALFPALLVKAIPEKTAQELHAVQSALQRLEGVQRASFNSGTTTFSSFSTGKSTQSSYINASVFLGRRREDDEAIAYNSAEVILKEWPEAMTESTIRINVVYGFDIGIASSWRSRSFAYSPAEWSRKIAERRNR
jgi:uncharacterized RDD family membrane protein YckC